MNSDNQGIKEKKINQNNQISKAADYAQQLAEKNGSESANLGGGAGCGMAMGSVGCNGGVDLRET